MMAPSEYYLHDVKKFLAQRKKGDTVKCYQANSRSWSKSKFLNASHKQNALTSREGRKLNLAEYNRRVSKSAIKVKKAAPFNKLSSYVIPSEKKRSAVVFDIRMKMLRSSGISFNRAFSVKPR